MSRINSAYERRELDFYPTPRWVLHVLNEVVPMKGLVVWEPACGNGEMAEAIVECGGNVVASDIHNYGYAPAKHHDFLKGGQLPFRVRPEIVVSNPPYGQKSVLAEAFVERGLTFIANGGGTLALLLPVDFDSAKTRAKFFKRCPMFAGTIVLTKRIKWFDHPVPCKPCAGSGSKNGEPCKRCGGKGEKTVGPSENHAWFIWSKPAPGQAMVPRKFYGPDTDAKEREPEAA